jgi:nucleotide-binding universal stress UspA family protein
VLDNVLVPLDRSPESEEALVIGAALADKAGASLRAVICISAGSDRLDHESYVEELCERTGTDTDLVEIIEGDDVPATISAAAAEQPGTVVCMRTHARGRIAQLVLGSVSEAVVRSGSCPVLLVGPQVETTPSFDRLQVCLDGSPASEAILPFAVEWAKRLDSRLWLFEAVSPELGSSADVPDTIYVHRMAERIEDEHGLEADYVAVHQRDAADGAVDFAKEKQVGIIALATHGHSGLRYAALGSVAMKVAHEAPCPVLVLRPKA